MRPSKRRNTNGVKFDREYATGLALSGGGIRSATFSLGVLIALARRNLLPDFDYLSTVSGGGYLGSFLTTFLSTKGDATESHVQNLGLYATQRPFLKEEGEAQALRHLRHHSKYLQTSWIERIVMAATQIYGMLVNSIALALIPTLLALFEYLARNTVGSRLPDFRLGFVVAAVLMGTAIILPLLVRIAPSIRRRADTVLAWLAVPLFFLVLSQ